MLNAMFVIVVIAGLSAGTILNLKPGGTFDSRRYAADNMCNVNPGSCKTEQDWINGWFEARKDENKDSTPKQDEYTNARDDQNNNPSDGQQVEIIRHTDESGVGDPGVGNRTGEQSTVTNQITKDESGNDVISTQTTPTTTVSAQQSSTAVSLEGASPEGVSPEVQSALASQTSRCSPTLHLCPMIDPKTNQVVGWVPATQAVYGTFEDAKLARLNIDFGNLNDSTTGIYAQGLTPNDADGGVAFREFTTNALETKEHRLTADQIAEIARLAEQNMVKLNPDGTVKKDATGNIVTNTGTLQVSELHQREQAFQTEQTQAADNAYQRVLGGLGCTQLSGTVNCNSEASTFVTACAKENNVSVCNPEELKAYVLTIPDYVQLRGNAPNADKLVKSIREIADQTAINALAAARTTTRATGRSSLGGQ